MKTQTKSGNNLQLFGKNILHELRELQIIFKNFEIFTTRVVANILTAINRLRLLMMAPNGTALGLIHTYICIYKWYTPLISCVCHFYK